MRSFIPGLIGSPWSFGCLAVISFVGCHLLVNKYIFEHGIENKFGMGLELLVEYILILS